MAMVSHEISKILDQNTDALSSHQMTQQYLKYLSWASVRAHLFKVSKVKNHSGSLSFSQVIFVNFNSRLV